MKSTPRKRQQLRLSLINERSRHERSLENPDLPAADRQKLEIRIAEIDDYMEEHFADYPRR